jgi:hypothetical protein
MAPSAVCDMVPSEMEGVRLESQEEIDSLAENLRQGVAVSNVGTQKTVKRRTTFSISPEHMQEAQRSFRQNVALITEKNSFFGGLQEDSPLRRDSAIDLDDNGDDDVITAPPPRPDTDYTPHEINAKDYMDQVLRGKIKFPPVKQKRMTLSEEVKRRVVEKAARMPKEAVLMVKSGMDQAATLALPDGLKT